MRLGSARRTGSRHSGFQSVWILRSEVPARGVKLRRSDGQVKAYGKPSILAVSLPSAGSVVTQCVTLPVLLISRFRLPRPS